MRITIGGLMKAVAGAALVSAALAATARSESGRPDGRQLTSLVGVMALVVGVDIARLVRRARAGGPGWSLRSFVGGLLLVWFCLCLPFLVPALWEWRLLVWLPLAPIWAGFAAAYPLYWVIPLNSPWAWPLTLVSSTLLIMVLVRLVARGWLFGACALALVASVMSALLIVSIMMSV